MEAEHGGDEEVTVSTFYPSRVSPLTGGGVSIPLLPGNFLDDGALLNGGPGLSASAFFDFSSIPSTATINSVKLETRFGYTTHAPSESIYVYGRTETNGYMWGGGDLLPGGYASATYYAFSYTGVVMSMATLKNSLRVDFGGDGRFDYIRVIVDWTAASVDPGTPTTPKSNVTVTAVRTSGATVAAGSVVTTAITVANANGGLDATSVEVETTSNASVSSRTWVRNDTGQTGSGQIDVTLGTLAANASVVFYVTDVISSGATGNSYACAGTVTIGSDNTAGSPLAFTSGSATVVAGTDPNPTAALPFDNFIDGVWTPFVRSYTVPSDDLNPNWEVRQVRITVSGNVYMVGQERNQWNFELQVGVTNDGVYQSTSSFPTQTMGTAAGGRTVGGGHLHWEQTFAVAPGDVLQVTLRGRMHGYFVPPSTTENHVYISPVRVEFEPRN